jgi:hypothetical protein
MQTLTSLNLPVYQTRGGLARTRAKLAAGGPLTVGFLGGSITDGRVPYNWPEPVVAWLVETFPGVRVAVENAAIGATGSELGVFNAGPHILAHDCDLVFVEYAVNDAGEVPVKRARTREGLLRKLLRDSDRDVLLVYTYGQNMYDDMIAGRVPASIADFETLGAHYGLSSVWMGLHALEEVKAGRMRWEEWLPDGLHPQFRGSFSYGTAVTTWLARELLDTPAPARPALPAPLDPRCWADAHALPLAEIATTGPWHLRRWPGLKWIDQVLETHAPGARLAFDFTGRGVTLGFDFGRLSSEFRWRIDGGDWQTSQRDRPDWCGNDGWLRLSTLADDLPDARHTCELEVIHGNATNCNGTTCRLALVGVVR